MDLNFVKAKELLVQGDFTCVVLKDDKIYTSKDRGVKPLLDWLEAKMNFENAVVADKVVGKAAAFLYVLLGVKEIYAGVVSEPALRVMERYGIKITYGEQVKAIRNRDNTGFCPMEKSVWEIEDPNLAYETILKTRQKLLSNKI